MGRRVTIVAMADTHGCQVEVPPGDILIHAGDLTGRGTLTELTRVRDWLRSLPHAHKVIVAGNHDFAFERQPDLAREMFGKPLIYLQDSEVTLEGLRIWGAPWQPWFHDWAFNVRRGPAIDAKWKLIPEGLDVLITHGPPAGYGDRTDRGERVGCEDLKRQLDRIKPRVMVFGHIHEDRGEWRHGDSRLFNVTTSYDEFAPTVIELEVAA